MSLPAVWRLVLAAFAVTAVLNLLWLGSAPLADTTEARHAEVGREFAEGGNWLVPRLNYRPHLTKPPLTDWLVAIGILIFGENEFGARFGNALAAALGIALTVGFAARLAGQRAGIAAGVLLFTTPTYLVLGRTISIDILLATLAVAAYWAAWEASAPFEGRPSPLADAGPPAAASRLPVLVFWLALGLGAAAKGHIVLLVVLLPVLVWLAAGRRWRAGRILLWPPTLLLFLLTALPWFVYTALTQPGWLNSMLANELGQRTVGAEFGDANFGLSLAFFLGAALTCVPLALVSLLSRRDPVPGDAAPGSPGTGGARSLLALWAGLPLAVFSLVCCQRANYVAPLVPAAAILAGVAWAALEDRWSQAPRAHRAAAWTTVAVTGLGGASAVVMPLFTPNQSAALSAILIAAGCCSILAAGAALLAMNRSGTRGAAAAFTVLALAVWSASSVGMMEIKSARSVRSSCRVLAERAIPPNAVVLFCRGADSSTFYMRSRLKTSGEASSRHYVPDTEADRLYPSRRDISNLAGRPNGLWLLSRRGDDRPILDLAASLRLKLLVADQDGGAVLIRARRAAADPRQCGARADDGRGLAFDERMMAALRDRIRRGGTTDRRLAADWLERLGPAAAPAVPELLSCLEDPAGSARAAAARALGRIGVTTPNVVQALVRGLSDREICVRQCAALSLGRLRADSADSGDALVSALDDVDVRGRESAAVAVGMIGSRFPATARRAAVEKLARSLADASAALRACAVHALGRLRASWDDCGPAVLACCEDDDWVVRRNAATAVARLADPPPKAVRQLLELLKDGDFAVRAGAAAALGSRGGRPEIRAAERALATATADRNWEVRLRAIEALSAAYPGSRTTATCLRTALRDNVRPVRTRAAELLARSSEREPLPGGGPGKSAP